MVDQIGTELLVRRLVGTATAGDMEELERRMAEDPEYAAFAAHLQALWDGLEGAPLRFDSAAAWVRVQERIHRPGPTAPAREVESLPVAPPRFPAARNPLPIPVPAPLPARRRLPAAARRAAAVLLVAAAGAGAWSLTRSGAAPELQRFATAEGQRATVTLGDGSRVLLAPGTVLEVESGRRGGPRSVRLEGMAHFDVVRNPQRPFLVESGPTTTEVLGTRFTVRGYPAAPVEVGVEEGRVSVRMTASPEGSVPVLLGPGEAAEVRDGEVRGREGAADDLLGWTDGRLVFRDRTLAEVAHDLERWYNVRVNVPSSHLAARRVTLSFQDAPLEEVLGALRLSLGLTIEQEGREVTLEPG